MELIELNAKNLATMPDPPYKERAVDVPDSFVGMIKQTPKYPPPQPRQRAANKQTPSKEKLKQYSEDLNKKNTEEAFIRSSLRESKKLHNLEKNAIQMTKTKNKKDVSNYAINDAFESDDVFGQKDSSKLDLNGILERVVEQVNDNDVKTIANRTDLAKLISIYNSIIRQKKKRISFPSVPILASDLVQDVVVLLQEETGFNSEAEELLEILNRFELNGLFSAFDHVLSNQLDSNDTNSSNLNITEGDSKLQNILSSNEALNYAANSNVKIVQIEKSSCEPLGATARNDPDGSVIIGRIVKGGVADKCGLLKEGDEILEVNGIEMKSRNIHQVCDLLSAMKGTLTFVIAPSENSKSSPTDSHQHIIHLKSLFDYDPESDLYIPCRELGLAFAKGDILHVIDQSDINWWQAYREEGHDSSLPGLIPSAHFHHKRMKQSILTDSSISSINYKSRHNKRHYRTSFLLNCAKKSRKVRKSQGCFGAEEEILTYEEVALYYPRANLKRPIVLIGPNNIGRHELRQKLMQDTERFSAAVPHTSRTRKEGEINGIDYHFITRQVFEQDIKEGKFVEHGEFEKNYYGTSLGAIETVVHSGKICVLNLHVHSLSILRQGHAGAKLKPYFVFVAPPPQIERLSKLILSTCNGQQKNNGTNYSLANNLQSVIDEARDIESRYGHYFDFILTINDIDQAFHDLLREINALEREPQWIPNIWMKD